MKNWILALTLSLVPAMAWASDNDIYDMDPIEFADSDTNATSESSFRLDRSAPRQVEATVASENTYAGETDEIDPVEFERRFGVSAPSRNAAAQREVSLLPEQEKHFNIRLKRAKK